jgi:hypothetical protein
MTKEKFQQMMLNVSPEIQADLVNQRRRTGKTLGEMLITLGKALQVPNTKIKICDYEPYAKIDLNTNFKTNLLPQLEHLIEVLDLSNLIINKSDRTLTYDLSFMKLPEIKK